MRTNKDIQEQVLQRFGEVIEEVKEPHRMLTLQVASSAIISVLTYLKEELSFTFLTDLTGVHYPKQEKQFAVVYHLHDMVTNTRVRVKTYLSGDTPTTPTATSLWNGANWMERETFDFYGINFEGHPDLRRILNMEDLDVFPMRKEYPLEDPNKVDKKDFYFGR